jgi:hypothetical protein
VCTWLLLRFVTIVYMGQVSCHPPLKKKSRVRASTGELICQYQGSMSQPADESAYIGLIWSIDGLRLTLSRLRVDLEISVDRV